MWENNAFSQGVEPGGLLNSSAIRVLVCYMLSGVDEPMTRDTVVQIITAEGMANYFETEAAIDELIRLGNLLEDEDGRLILTAVGKEASAALTSQIPFTLRERSVEAALRLLARRKKEREYRVDIEPLEEGGVSVTCAIDRTDHPMMSVSLRVADTMQAQLIKERFLDDPASVYRLLISLLAGEATAKTFGTRTILELHY